MPSLSPEPIHTDQAPKAIGPYSQAQRVGDFVFTAGQIGLDPQTGQLVAGGIDAQTRQVLQNLSAVLDAAGSSLASVVKATIFVQDLGDYGQVNTVYTEFFPETKPARSTVQVAALPRGALVEIECIAVVSAAK